MSDYVEEFNERRRMMKYSTRIKKTVGHHNVEASRATSCQSRLTLTVLGSSTAPLTRQESGRACNYLRLPSLP